MLDPEISKRRFLILGVAVNDADYPISPSHENGRRVACSFYNRWKCMLWRCYKSVHPTYKGCYVCDEWLYFSNFKSWMETQDWEGKDLDKDLLIRGNQVYSPETCVFIDQKVNKFISEKLTNKKAHLIGAYFLPKRGKFKSVSYDVLTGKQKHLGNYNTEEEAHNAWLSFKLEQAHILAAQQSDQRVAKALVNRYKNYLILEDN